MTEVYVIGSLKQPERVREVAAALRAGGYGAFDDWQSAGPDADDRWQEYERQRGRSFTEALGGYHAQQVFAHDKFHLDRCDAAVLVLPAGKSGHLELGYMIGCGKPTFILMDGEPERYDVMYNFATAVVMSIDDLMFVIGGKK